MAQQGVQLDRETFSCSICLDLLKDPVTIPCGHSYCMNCIRSYWDEKDEKKIHSCPQCRQTFTPRPVLVKSTMLADLVEELKKTGLQAAPADHCYAGPEDVSCDVCTGRKLKAFKSCLFCLISFCEKHLQPHFESPAYEKHKLVDPSKKLQENICSRHDEVMKMFCRTDQQCICYLCSVDDHKGHDTVSAAAERTERQRELEVSRQNIQQRIQDREKDVKELQQQVEAINHSADKAVEDSEKIFTELISLIQKRSSDVKQQRADCCIALLLFLTCQSIIMGGTLTFCHYLLRKCLSFFWWRSLLFLFNHGGTSLLMKIFVYLNQSYYSFVFFINFKCYIYDIHTHVYVEKR
uniref:E3 ubiquitin/ISG15 ligase TRIM25-like n=1 Tax=Dicentrarchus labrax TaxID=13489 RepID=A0A8P4KML8_DICLA